MWIISKIEKSPTQSPYVSKKYVVEYKSPEGRDIEGVMGWTSSSEMRSELKLFFDSLESAKDFLDGKEYLILETKPKKFLKKKYSDNFTRN